MVKAMTLIVWMSYYMPAYGMDEELNSSINRSRNSYTLFGMNQEWFSRYCPSWCRSERVSHKIPIIAPTQPSSMATVSSQYSKKRIAMIAGLTLSAGVVGYYIGNTCQMCTVELRNAQRYVGELDDAFNACTETTTYLNVLINNFTEQVAECVTSVDNLTQAIIEHCGK